MAINVSQAFKRTSANPIDESLTLTKAQMVATNDNLMPSKYLTVCQDDGKIYLYDKSNESDVSTGRFREYQAGSSAIIDPTPTQGSTNAVQSGGTYTALDGKVDKVTGKGLSTEDYTTAEQTKLSGVETGAEVNAIEGITLNGDTVTPDANRIIALTVITNTVNNLLNYYNKTETYTKAEVDALVSAVAGATFESVNTLPTTDIKTNVIYLVPKQDPQAGDIKDEYINLDGTTSGWEHIGDTQVDLSNYVTKTELSTALADYTNTADLTTLLAGKVDKVTGKGLSTNDYTTEEKTKLAGLSNYDDTALSGRVSDIEDVVPSTATTSNKLATMADVGGTSGHTIEDSTGVDMTARANLQFIGATVSDDSTNDRTIVTVDISGKADKVSGATNGNFAGLDANGNLTDSGEKASDFASASDLDEKEDAFRLSTMPVASATYANGKSYQYIGSTTSTYTHNYFYECKAQETDPETYIWEEVRVSEASEERLDSAITKVEVRYDTTRQNRFVPMISVNLADLLTKGGRVVTVDDLVYAKELLDEGRITQAEFNAVYDVVSESFSTASFEVIKTMADLYYDGTLSLNDIKAKWSMGDTKTISLEATDETASQDVTMKIVDFDHDILTTAIGEKTKALLTFGFVISENKARGTMGWKTSGLRTLCESLITACPSGLQTVLKAVDKETDNGNSALSTVNTTSDKLFIPSAKEFTNGVSVSERSYHASIQYGAGGGTVYAYYNASVNNRKLGKNCWTTTGDSYYHSGDGQRHYDYAIYLTSDGGRYDATASTAMGVAPHGCI